MKTGKITVLFVTLVLLVAPLLVMRTVHAAANPIYYSVEPVAIAPLTDINASINGLETPATPSPVGQNVTVEIHLKGATAANVPGGVSGVEIHFYFGNILTYAVPTGFTDFLGKTDGALTGGLLFGISPSFFAADLTTKITSPPYTGAVYYAVAAASMGGGWNGADGLVAKITFQIIKQPQSSSGEPTVFLALENDFTDMTDTLAVSLSHDRVQGTLTIDATPGPQPAQYYALTVNVVGNGSVTKNPVNATYLGGTNVTLTAIPDVNWTFLSWSGDLTGRQSPVNITMDGNKTVTATFVQGLPGDLNHDGKVSLEDLSVFAIAWRSHTGDPKWNPECDLADPKGEIGLTDFVTFAIFYGSSLQP
jgi:hypothetical protein